MGRKIRADACGGAVWAKISSQLRAASSRNGVSKENLLYYKILIENILTRGPNKFLTYLRLDDKMAFLLSFCENL